MDMALAIGLDMDMMAILGHTIVAVDSILGIASCLDLQGIT